MTYYNLSNLTFDLEGNVTFQVDLKVNRVSLWTAHLSVKCDGIQFERMRTFKYWEGHKLAEIFPEASEFFNEMDDRLNRYNSTSIVEPSMFSEGEFIEVDRHSSFHGNYELNGKEGCYATIFTDEFVDLTMEVFDPRHTWSVYDLPLTIRSNIGGFATDIVYNWTRQEKIDYFKKLPIQVRRDLILSQLANLKVCIQCNKPFGVRLSGNDDDSWTKYFDTQQECEDELNYLRKMQPTNKEMDIINRGYIFT